MEHRSFAPDIVVPNDDYACGNKRAGELAPDVAPEELRQEKQVGGTVNCSDSELCTFSLALEAGFLPTYYSDTNQSVQLKSMSIASRSYQHGKKTVAFHGFPSLQMSSNLTEDHGEAMSMLSAVDSLAKTFHPQEKVQELKAPDPECGFTWQGSFARFDRDSSSWKTPQCSLLEGLDVFSETWPRWGTMRNGECWELTTLAGLTNGNGFGSWPTPTKSDAKRCRDLRIESLGKRAQIPGAHWNLAEHVAAEYEGYPTPQFVAWLMAWPQDWTSLKPLGMDKCQQWQQQHSGF